MEVLCIDDNYNQIILDIWAKYGVKYPKEGKIYSIRKVISYVNNDKGLLLNEIINPHVSLDLMGRIGYTTEPSFNIKRFTHLDGTPLTSEELKELSKKKEKDFVKVKPIKKTN